MLTVGPALLGAVATWAGGHATEVVSNNIKTELRALPRAPTKGSTTYIGFPRIPVRHRDRFECGRERGAGDDDDDALLRSKNGGARLTRLRFLSDGKL